MHKKTSSFWIKFLLNFYWPAILLAGVTICVAQEKVETISNSTGITVGVEPNGRYTISSQPQDWKFSGETGAPISGQKIKSGADRVGDYSEISFIFTNESPRAAAIRVYRRQPVVIFSETCLGTSPNNTAFPCLTTYPQNLHHISYNGIFGNYSFKKLGSDSPWLFFDNHFNSFLISPATNFMIAKTTESKDEHAVSSGIDPAITQLPPHFNHEVVFVIENGINHTFQTYGDVLTGLSGKIRPANDAAVELNKLGYWTDNGAFYYYHYEKDKGYAGTLLEIRDKFVEHHLPLGYMQLDSWWYLKSPLATWEGSANNNRGGVFLYQASKELFPNGLAAFQQKLGLPLVTHNRWVDPASPYRKKYHFSKNVPIDAGYWQEILNYAANAGVVTYEQDWLNQNMLPHMNLHDPPAFMNEMAAAAASHQMNLQYCMSLPRHYLQSSLYDNALTIRVTGDRFRSYKWDAFLYDSRFADAVGIWPWCDVFMSKEGRNLLVDTLSAGPVGVGDALGKIDFSNLSKVARPDSVIVKPDVSLMPIDRSYLNDAEGKKLPMVASTYTDHGGFKTFYVFSYARSKTNLTSEFSPAKLGVNGDAYVYNYFKKSGEIVKRGDTFDFTTTPDNPFNGGSYFIVAPVGPSGIAFLGDLNKFVPAGKKRISALSDSGKLEATVQFATGEKTLTVSGYAPSRPKATAKAGSVKSLHYDSRSHLFKITISPDRSQRATFELSL